jgi:ABC-type lipoprotein export system ATPase subunit
MGLHEIDKAICGDYQVPATQLGRLTDNNELAKELANGRVKVATGTGLEVAGTSLATWGLTSENMASIFALGVTMKICGRMVAFHHKNKNGSLWTLNTVPVLDSLGHFKVAVNAALINQGVSSEEVKLLFDLPNALYRAELFSPNLNRLKTATLPVASAAALALNEQFITSGLIAGFGILAIPIGEFAYKQADVRRAAQLRVGRSAGAMDYRTQVLEQHVKMTDGLNILSQTPDLLFALVNSLSDTAGALPALYGLQQGLTGLTGTLSDQRNREAARRTTEIANKMIDMLTNKPFIGTHQRWLEHIEESGCEQVPRVEFTNGIAIRNFVSMTPTGENTKLLPISVDCAGNSACILKAESGTGKSLTLMSIMHRLEHTGSVHFFENGKPVNVHDLCGPSEIESKIAMITDNNFDPNNRVVDLFRQCFQKLHGDIYENHIQQHNEIMIRLAWNVADNLLEEEIKKIELSEVSVFPENMLDVLKEIGCKRNEWVNQHINMQKGNMTSDGVHATRVYSSLSKGEQTRMVVCLAEAVVDANDIVAVVLDEPLAHLDNTNRQYQLGSLRRIQESKVALIIVSHDDIGELQLGLNNCEVVNIETKDSD